jgi:mannose-1-phosphate guanylyltransferase
MDPIRSRWSIVLAAGEGSRLNEITRDWRGLAVPKQFCSFQGGRTMLQVTLERAKRVAPPDHIIPIVAAHHAQWWEGQLSEHPAENVVVQPENRGTAPGVLLPLLTILRRWRRPAVAIFPTDHHVEDERALSEAVERALGILEPKDPRIIVLGMRPESPEPDYGWIDVGTAGQDGLRLVHALLEKPGAQAAEQLFRTGAFWNSFILVARGEALLRLFEETQPLLVRLFQSTMRHHGWSPGTLRHLYGAITDVDFTRDVLARMAEHMRVLPVRPCGWVDIGTPERLSQWLHETQREPVEAAQPAGQSPREGPLERVGAG